ncbi:hypothetical protein HYW74_02120 [Candidatus Pacearchaeota archaeon]|nr:hypothetical protein [Candidatus Pacearchaeota archaeon]
MKISKKGLASLIGVAGISLVPLLSSGCETFDNSYALEGGLLGAGAGAIIGNQRHGQSGEGAVIGGIFGGLLGSGVERRSSRQRQVYRNERVLVPESYVQDRNGNWVNVPEHYEIREYRVR